MSNGSTLQVYSEIGRLKKVLLHRPGLELENLMPEVMERLLFDDIPYLEVARNEHDAFANIFTNNGIEVLYLEDLVTECIADSGVRAAFVQDFINEAGIHGDDRKQALNELFSSFKDHREMVDKMMAGIRKEEIVFSKKSSLSDLLEDEYPFIVDPMPNLYFTRDPFATIGTGISLNRMRTTTRRRETLFAKYIFEHHKDFKRPDVKYWYNRNEEFSIEGGDILILNEKILAVGISQRTDSEAIERLAKSIFADGESFETILAFDIPKSRAYMHLDTVFTMVDFDKFTIHPEIEGPLTVYSITKKANGAFDIEKETMVLENILKKYLELEEVTLVRCGGKRGIDAGREQWNDGSNTLAIAPGEVIVYSRNHVTNKLLVEEGIKIHVMPSSELSRGRGGPRCMSMPLIRESLIR
jgi:arginine deiminase